MTYLSIMFANYIIDFLDLFDLRDSPITTAHAVDQDAVIVKKLLIDQLRGKKPSQDHIQLIRAFYPQTDGKSCLGVCIASSRTIATITMLSNVRTHVCLYPYYTQVRIFCKYFFSFFQHP